MRYSLLTFGCRVNQADSLGIDAELRRRGGVPAPATGADLIIVNSCSVTATADQGTRQAVRRATRENPSARIVVTGCYATRRPREVAALPGVTCVIGNDEKDGLVERLSLLVPPEDEATSAMRDAGGDGPCGAHEPGLLPGALGRTAFTLRVQTGCDEPCSYCIIPSTRGRSRSLPLDRLIAELGRIEASGYLEVTLTGVHLGAYGRDLDPPVTLATLVARALDATGRLVFRLGSLEPMDCTRELMDLVAGDDRVAPALHLPMQHASEPMLAAMRRPYTRRQYEALVETVRVRLPHASIGSDIIVGFPGETDEDADELVTYLASSPLTHLHVFPYSDRPGTEAAAMSPKVHGAIVRERSRRVRDVGQELAMRFQRSQLGSVRPALTIEDGSAVVTDNGLRLTIDAGRARNQRVRVRVDAPGQGSVV